MSRIFVSSFGEIVSILAQAWPKFGKYGVETGGNAGDVIAALSREDLMCEIDHRLVSIEAAYTVKTRKAYQEIEAASKEREAARSDLVRVIRNWSERGR